VPRTRRPAAEASGKYEKRTGAWRCRTNSLGGPNGRRVRDRGGLSAAPACPLLLAAPMKIERINRHRGLASLHSCLARRGSTCRYKVFQDLQIYSTALVNIRQHMSGACRRHLPDRRNFRRAFLPWSGPAIHEARLQGRILAPPSVFTLQHRIIGSRKAPPGSPFLAGFLCRYEQAPTA
jgi:hypothetical protein